MNFQTEADGKADFLTQIFPEVIKMPPFTSIVEEKAFPLIKFLFKKIFEYKKSHYGMQSSLNMLCTLL